MTQLFDFFREVHKNSSDIESNKGKIRDIQLRLRDLKDHLMNESNNMELGKVDMTFFQKSVLRLLSVNEVKNKGLKIPEFPIDFLQTDESYKLDSYLIKQLCQIGQGNLEDSWVAFNQNTARLIYKIKKKTADNTM